MYGYIYKNTDLTNGMLYIGKHKYDKPELDPTYHGSGTRWGKIYKSRPETTKEEIIDIVYSKEELNEKEKYWIKKLNTKWPNGYNFTDGGDGNSGPMDEETKIKISISTSASQLERYKDPDEHIKTSIAIKEKYKDEDYRKRKNDSQIKRFEDPNERLKVKVSNKKTWSNPELLKNHSIMMTNKWKDPKVRAKHCKPVLQYSLDGEFIKEWESSAEIHKTLGYNNIGRCCNGKVEKMYGYIWKWKNPSLTA